MTAAGRIGGAAANHQRRATRALSGRWQAARTALDLMPLTWGAFSALLWGLFGLALYLLIAGG
jgi:hypothetical protein